MTQRRASPAKSVTAVPVTAARGTRAAPHSAIAATPRADSQPEPQAEPRDVTTPGVPPPSQDPADAPLPRSENDAFPFQDPEDAPLPRSEVVVPFPPPQMPPVPEEKEVEKKLRWLRIDREARRRLDNEEHPPLPLPPLATLRDRLACPRSATRWRIEGWLPVDARVMLAAQYKAGKTTLVCNLIRSFVDGDLWLGTAAVMPIEGTVVLIDTEMSPSQLDEWYAAQGIAATDRVVPVPLRGALTTFNILDASVRAELATRLRALDKRYLIFDCLRPIFDALGLDEQRDGGRFLVAFDVLLREANILEAAVITHMGHSGEHARGDSRFRDWPDVEWRLFREHDDPASARFISAYGRDVNIEECALAYNDAFRQYTLTGRRLPPRRRRSPGASRHPRGACRSH